MDVEVGVNLEEAVAFDLVQPAADEIRVGHQSGDAGQRLQEGQGRRAVQLMDDLTGELAELSDLPGAELLVVAFIDVLPLVAVWGRNSGAGPRTPPAVENRR